LFDLNSQVALDNRQTICIQKRINLAFFMHLPDAFIKRFLLVLAFPWNQTHDLDVASTMLYSTV